MAAPGSGIKFLGLDSALVDLAEKKSTLSNNKQEYFTASDIANGITAFDNGIVINEAGADSDTRIEGQSDANLFFVDASTDRVGIGTNTPAYKLDVSHSSTNVANFKSSGTGSNVYFQDGTTASIPYICATGDFLDLYSSGERKLTLRPQQVCINEAGANIDFRIEGQTDTNLFRADASTDRVGVGTSSPSYKLDVNGDVNVASGSAYYHNGTAGLSGTYTFGGGTTGDIATMTFNGGILTAVTTVP